MDAPVLATTRPQPATTPALGSRPPRFAVFRPRPFAFVIPGVCGGLLAGLVGVAIVLAQATWPGAVRTSFLTLNRNTCWMMPVADGVLLSAAGLAVGLVAWRFPRFGARGAAATLIFLACLEVLCALDGLHWAARLTLAAGLSSWGVRGPAFAAGRRPVAWRTVLPVLLFFTAWEGAVAFYFATAESRTTAALPAVSRETPNVLLVVLDTVRADRLSLYGYPRETTPNLDRLAQRGVRFDQARAAAPYTMPSHASLFTGRWPHELNHVQYAALDGTYPTLAEVLRDRGFRTGGFVGNTYYCNEWFGLARGFSHYEDYPQRTEINPRELLHAAGLGRILLAAGAQAGLADPGIYDQRVTAADVNRRALAWLDQQDTRGTRAPFFLFLNYIDAHAPYFPPAGSPTRYSNPANTARAYALLSKTQRKKLSENTAQDHADRLEAARLLGDAYDDCLRSVDAQLGRLLAELDRRGLRENTLIIVTADHGDHIGEHELFGHATSLYQALVHVPLVIVPPRGKPAAGQVVAAPVSLRAIPATVLDLLGLDRTRHPFPGAPLIRAGRDRATGKPVLSELDMRDHSRNNRPGQWHSPAGYGPMQALAAEGLVYIHNGNGREELYELAGDPAEQHDLAARPEFLPALDRFRQELKRQGALE